MRIQRRRALCGLVRGALAVLFNGATFLANAWLFQTALVAPAHPSWFRMIGVPVVAVGLMGICVLGIVMGWVSIRVSLGPYRFARMMERRFAHVLRTWPERPPPRY